MKVPPIENRSGVLSLRAALLIVAIAAIPLLAFAAAPAWWSQRGVLTEGANANDYAPANQGQLKNIARAAVAEMDAVLPEGAGDALHDLVNGWASPTAQTNDFAPVNLGQLKKVAKPFYDRLIAAGLAYAYPWSGDPNPPDNFAIANIGQVKKLFSFDPSATIDPLYDGDGNGLPDSWEQQYFGQTGVDPNADPDGDGVSNLQEYQNGTDPTDYYNGSAPSVSVVSGDAQIGEPNAFLPAPLVVQITDSNGEPLFNAPVVFSGSNGYFALTNDQNASLSSNLTVRTGSDGQAAVYFQTPELASVISILATAELRDNYVSATFTATANPASIRYAVIDLGVPVTNNVQPVHLTNSGFILFTNYDETIRWHEGQLEYLTGGDWGTGGVDINESGTAVGFAFDGSAHYPSPPIGVDGEIFPRGGWYDEPGTFVMARWAPQQSAASLGAGETVFDFSIRHGGRTDKGKAKFSSATTIDNNGNVFGTALVDYQEHAHFVDPNGVGSGPTHWGSVYTGIPGPMGNRQVVWDENANHFTAEGEEYHITKARNGTTIGTGSSGHFLNNLRVDFLPRMPADARPYNLNSHGAVLVSAPAPGSEFYDPTEKYYIYDTTTGVSGVLTDLGVKTNYWEAGPSALNHRTISVTDASGQSSTKISPQVVVNGAILEEDPETGQYRMQYLGNLISPNSGWTQVGAYDINDHGVIVATGTFQARDANGPIGEPEGRACLLLPAELVVDANRDGKVDDRDRGKVSEQTPWHFWYNEDNDSGETGGDDIPLGSAQGDFGGGTVSGIRDLVDFFPVFLDIKELVKVLPPESNTYKLKAEGGAFKFVYTDLTPADSGKYLRDIATAEILKAADKTLVGAGSSATLDPAFLNKIKDESKGVLLIEAGTKTDKPLVLEVYKGSEKLTELKLYVKTDSVEMMFRHRNLLAANGQNGGRADYDGKADGSGPENYPDRLCSNKKFVLVHGYNVNPEQARGWNGEAFKRLFWSGSKAKFYGITWYGSETQIPFVNVAVDYQANVDNAFATAQSLAQCISGLGGNVTVAAHSLGNMVVGSAMHDWQATGISNYFMVDAAVAKEAYDPAEEQLATQTTWGMDHPDWYNYQRRLWCSDWHKLFPTNDNRSTLTWDGRLESVTNVFNFYSSGEEVLANPSSAPGIPTGPGEVWNNQERMKGRMQTGQVLSSNYGGWRFTNYYNEGQVNYPQIPPAQTTSITEAQLMEHPFFWSGPAELYGSNGSNYASPQQHRNTLLAEMVPALSFAAGSNSVTRFGANNVNMQIDLKNGWPTERGESVRWFHSDVRNIAYLFTHKAFDKFVELGGLN